MAKKGKPPAASSKGFLFVEAAVALQVVGGKPHVIDAGPRLREGLRLVLAHARRAVAALNNLDTAGNNYPDFLAWRAVCDSVSQLREAIRREFFIPSDPECETAQFAQLNVQENAALARIRVAEKTLSAWAATQPYGGPNTSPPSDAVDSMAAAADFLQQVLPEPGKMSPPSPEPKPCWNGRTLRYGETICCTIKKGSRMGRILDVFEEERWRNGVDSPFPPGMLKQHLDNLRKKLKDSPVEIYGNDDDEGLRWRLR